MGSQSSISPLALENGIHGLDHMLWQDEMTVDHQKEQTCPRLQGGLDMSKTSYHSVHEAEEGRSRKILDNISGGKWWMGIQIDCPSIVTSSP